MDPAVKMFHLFSQQLIIKQISMFTTFFAEKEKKSGNHRFLGKTCNVSIVKKIDQHVVFVSLLIIEAFLWNWHSCGKHLVLLYCRPGVPPGYLRLLHYPLFHTHMVGSWVSVTCIIKLKLFSCRHLSTCIPLSTVLFGSFLHVGLQLVNLFITLQINTGKIRSSCHV